MANQLDPRDGLLLSQFVFDAITYLGEHGIMVDARTDFFALKELCESLPGKRGLGPPFDPEKNDIFPHQAFWLNGITGDGETIMMQAARLQDLGGLSIADHWQSWLPRLFDGEMSGDFPPAAQRIRGQVVYHGEAWTHKKHQSLGNAAVMGLLAKALALMLWRPDFIYGLCASKLEKSGFQLRLGYTGHACSAVPWTEVSDLANGDSWLVFDDFEGLIWMIRQPLAKYV